MSAGGAPAGPLFPAGVTPEEMRDFALASPENYRRMAEREGEVWGRIQTDPRVAELRAEDMAAAAELGLNGGAFNLPAWLREGGRRFEVGLSLGCGNGRAERDYVARGVCGRFHGLDIAEASVAEARRLSAEAGQANTYEVADLNFADLGEARYDFILAQTSLHHLVHLERVLDAIRRALRPGGLFFLHDYVGESQFQHAPLRVAMAESVMRMIPPEFLVNRMNGRSLFPVTIPAPGRLVSPFESIRSGEILGLAAERFAQVAGGTRSSVMHLVAPVGTRAHYLRDEGSRRLFAGIMAFDRALIEHGVLRGADARIVFEAR